MTYRIQVKGLDKLQKALAQGRKGARQAMVQALEAVTTITESEIKPVTPVRTGRLRASITHKVTATGRTLRGVVYTTVEYAADVEFGTARMKPRRYFWTGLKNARPRNERALREINRRLWRS